MGPVCRPVLAASLLLVLACLAQGKPIHLRNQIIPAKPGSSLLHSRNAAAKADLHGLHLIQFYAAPTLEQRAQLAGMGIDLLHPVPEQAFVARFRHVDATTLGSLAFIEWVGEYQPGHKLHRSLRPEKGAAQRPTESVDVAVLLVPKATDAEIAEVRRSFRTVRQQSATRSATVLRGSVARAQLEALARSQSVLWIEPARDMKLYDEVSSKLVAGDGGVNTLLTQSLGYDGSGVTVAVADSGLNNGDAATMHPDLLGRTPAFFWYGSLTDAADEHSHGTHVAGIVAGNGATGERDENGALYGLGVAPGASIVAQRIFDGEGNYEPPGGSELLTRDAVRAGAVIGSNSWGDDTQGRYDISAMEFDELVRDADAIATGDQQYILEFSAGNAGPGAQTIGSPAVAKNVIATGASESDRLDFVIYGDGPETMADFSSRGPAEDGRIKPDVVAPGTWISSLQSQSATDLYAWAPISPNYQYQGGTSQAGPHVSGAAAVFVQYYRETHSGATPSPALVKAALINSAVELDRASGNGPVPNTDEGWGRVDLPYLLDPAVGFDYTDQSVLLTNGQAFERRVVVGSSDEAFNVTLAYTDPPGFPAAIPALVNDLDLEVVGPDGTLYRGNQFLNGESTPNPPAADHINNVEGVRLLAPKPGQYTVRVRAGNVVQDIHEALSPSQDFALVISGSLAPPGVGVLFLDRPAYRAPSQIKIVLSDSDQAGRASETATVRSTTEPAGEIVTLRAFGNFGVFTGAIATATGPAVPDGKLQIAANDLIECFYYDASANATRSATAVADFTAPAISGVTTANQFGQAHISWTTDEPASSIVGYGTNTANLVLAATNTGLSTNHSIILSELSPNITWYFYVASADEAGNLATNNNSGAFFSVIITNVPPVLLIDSYADDPMTGGAPDLSGYTQPLDAIGLGYDVWDVSTLGQPALSTLLHYRALVWRVSEFGTPWDATAQSAIASYLNAGGGLFVASMEILSRLEEVSATNFLHNVLHVQSFVADPASTGAADLYGSPVDPLTSSFEVVMDYTVYEMLWGGFIGPDISDTMTPGTNATSVLFNAFGDTVALRWPGLGQQAPGRLILCSFPLDAVPMGVGGNDRTSLLRRFLEFLAPGASGAESISLDSTAYTLPSTVSVEVGDAHAVGRGSVQVAARSTTQTNAVSVTLYESPKRGVFNGSFPVVAATNPPTSGKLRAASGDFITVQYSGGQSGTAYATATVDTSPPAISNVAATTDYVSASISWDLSKPADGLVQYGESALLNRTAYDPDYFPSHEVTLPFLEPDRTYYYRVVSRDVAGNVAIDDNGGQLYRFTTLRPEIAPWSDNLDTGATNWATFTDNSAGLFGSASPNWTLGTPNNQIATSAHSPPNAWGTNLKGEPADFQQCYLISPAIYLTNGNVVTLTFYHNYDFTDLSGYDYEVGDLQLITVDSSVTATLGTWSDSSFGWQEEQIDLSAYAGRVVYLVWEYVLFSPDLLARPGWLIDDVAITVTNLAPGSITISNNLWQARYVLSGSLYKKGRGPLTLSNAPPGTYKLEFVPVDYYITPPAQTKTLSPGGSIQFSGAYSFPDVNHNGISDLWEQRFFGNLSANRTQSTDTDGDGMSDYQEFIAGTDPNNPPRSFALSAQRLPGSLRLEWPAVVSQMYLLLGSTNAVSWTPWSSWMEATSATLRVDLPISATSPSQFFRVRSGFTNSPPGMAPNLRLTAQRLTNGVVKASWVSVPGRAYRLWTSTNGLPFVPSTGWTQAVSGATSLVLPPPLPGNQSWFRLEVQP